MISEAVNKLRLIKKQSNIRFFAKNNSPEIDAAVIKRSVNTVSGECCAEVNTVKGLFF